MSAASRQAQFPSSREINVEVSDQGGMPMQSAIQLASTPLAPSSEKAATPRGEWLRFAAPQRADLVLRLAAENKTLRAELSSLRRLLAQQDELLRNARKRELELRAALTNETY
ncbi:MAG: hypothetical protein HY300_12475 [Verrucomicrobia bacterium]|nr:hypothetical protein [Verrucomicrobiota bacterium]